MRVTTRVAFGAEHCGNPQCELCSPEDLIHDYITEKPMKAIRVTFTDGRKFIYTAKDPNIVNVEWIDAPDEPKKPMPTELFENQAVPQEPSLFDRVFGNNRF